MTRLLTLERKHRSVASHMHWSLNPQPGYGPWPGIEPTAFRCTGQSPGRLSHWPGQGCIFKWQLWLLHWEIAARESGAREWSGGDLSGREWTCWRASWGHNRPASGGGSGMTPRSWPASPPPGLVARCRALGKGFVYKKGPGSSLSITWKEIVSSSSLATTRPQTHVCLWDPSLRLGPEGKEQASVT